MISKNIIIIWCSPLSKKQEIPTYYIEKLKYINKDKEVHLFTDDLIEKFFVNNYEKKYFDFYSKLKFGMYKADFFRYCYLYKFGGCYLDIDIENVNSINYILDNDYNYDFVSVLSIIKEHITQCILLVKKENKIIKMCIDDMFYYGPNIGIDPPNKYPYIGHPTKCMYDNICKFTELEKLNEGLICYDNIKILLGIEKIIDKRYKLFINNKFLGYSKYENYSRSDGFMNIIDKILIYNNSISKKIHISWNNKNVLDIDNLLIKYGIKNLKEINEDYELEISDDSDIDKYLYENLNDIDYNLIKNKKIVEKVDLWRLLKIYNEGGIYLDIDRFCNVSLKDIILKDTKFILPIYRNVNFSQDIMISCSNNPIFKLAIDLNLDRRRKGWKGILQLGPITYNNAIVKVLLKKESLSEITKEDREKIIDILKTSKTTYTYLESNDFDTILYKGNKPLEIKSNIHYYKKELYKICNVKHWRET